MLYDSWYGTRTIPEFLIAGLAKVKLRGLSGSRSLEPILGRDKYLWVLLQILFSKVRDLYSLNESRGMHDDKLESKLDS